MAGIDESSYDDVVTFEDPITRYSNAAGYMFNIRMLKKVRLQLESTRGRASLGAAPWLQGSTCCTPRREPGAGRRPLQQRAPSPQPPTHLPSCQVSSAGGSTREVKAAQVRTLLPPPPPANPAACCGFACRPLTPCLTCTPAGL
jgi:hypothetical protein